MNDGTAPGFRIDSESLRQFVGEILQTQGVPQRHAEITSESLVAADLRGFDSHGVVLLPGYLQLLMRGGVDGSASGAVSSERGCCLLYDGQNGLGQVVSERCTVHAIRLARQQGAAVVVARNSHHFGAAGFWSERMAAAGLIGIAMSTAGATVPHWGGRTLMFGTNPIGVAMPGGQWCLDMATSTVAHNKLSVAADWGETTIPCEWGFVGTDGKPTTELRVAEKGWSTPLGGYKGSGLAMLVELLCAGLSGGPMAANSPKIRSGEFPLEISHMFLAIDPRGFQKDFPGRVNALVDMVKASVPAEDFVEVIVAGEREARIERRRRKEGIVLPAALYSRLLLLATKLGVGVPRFDADLGEGRLESDAR